MKKLSENENIVEVNGIKLVIWYLIIESQNENIAAENGIKLVIWYLIIKSQNSIFMFNNKI